MTRLHVKLELPVLEAYASGKAIQELKPGFDHWEDTDNPIWEDGYRHRIKPETVWILRTNGFPIDLTSTRDSLPLFNPQDGRWIKFVEDTE